MLVRSLPVALMVLLTASPCAWGQEFTFDPWFQPGSFQDVGNIASDGSGGRQTVVRPLEQGETEGYVFFSEFDSAAGRYAKPPATPSQESLVLFAGQPLALALPQLAHFPSSAEVSVEHSILGNAIDVDAGIHFLGLGTNWYAPPHEYLHALGAFAPGDYRLTLDLSRSDWTYPDEPSVMRGFIDFTVVAVPEPAAWLMALGGAASAVSVRWRRVR